MTAAERDESSESTFHFELPLENLFLTTWTALLEMSRSCFHDESRLCSLRSKEKCGHLSLNVARALRRLHPPSVRAAEVPDSECCFGRSPLQYREGVPCLSECGFGAGLPRTPFTRLLFGPRYPPTRLAYLGLFSSDELLPCPG